MQSSAYNTALTLYFIGYIIFEIPANVCQSNVHILSSTNLDFYGISFFADHVSFFFFCIIRLLTLRGVV